MFIYLISFSLNFFHAHAVIPQTCWYNGNKFDCGLSISCVLEGGKPIDLCSGGMIWSCCVSKDKAHQTSGGSSSSSTSVTAASSNSVGTIENASECFFLFSYLLPYLIHLRFLCLYYLYLCTYSPFISCVGGKPTAVRITHGKQYNTRIYYTTRNIVIFIISRIVHV